MRIRYQIGIPVGRLAILPPVKAPLAERMRPRTLDEFIGQEHILGPGRLLRRAIQADHLASVILSGPPGTGKTTLARIIANTTQSQFLAINAVLAGVKDIREAIDVAQDARKAGRGTLLFVDEVHRFNKAQQDAFLPHVEDGTLTFIGATTENPSFEIVSALLSRARVYVLRALNTDELKTLLQRAAGETVVDTEALELLAVAADGDARRALNMLELATTLAGNAGEQGVSLALAREVASGGRRRFDKGGEQFYDQISALHKSVRGSDPDAALYWFARMIDGGCDPHYLARRMLRMASEDIGLADPRALTMTLEAWQAYERLGSPEGELALAQAVVFLAVAAKSNAVYKAYGEVQKDVEKYGTRPVPLQLRNAPTKLMADLGYGKDYRYAHDEAGAFAAGENYFPEDMPTRRYYHPVPRGLEIRIAEALERLRTVNEKAK